jgi:hypothetical protein
MPVDALMPMQRGRWLAVLGALVTATACDSSTTEAASDLCPADLKARIDRPAAVLRVGDSLRFEATAFRCNGTVPIATTWTWSTNDSAVLRVHAVTGWVYGVRVGESVVIATSQSLTQAVTAAVAIKVEP